MRLLLSRESGGGLFLQAEWSDVAGNHTKRLTEELPLPIFDHATSLLEWAEQYRDTDLVPKAEQHEEIITLEQEIAKMSARLLQLKGR